jgi:hypothetical protein
MEYLVVPTAGEVPCSNAATHYDDLLCGCGGHVGGGVGDGGGDDAGGAFGTRVDALVEQVEMGV